MCALRKTNPTKMAKLLKLLCDNFYAETPLQRYLMRGGRGRKSMQRYRAAKRVRRPAQFRQDVW
jgi:hypothetical protein